MALAPALDLTPLFGVISPVPDFPLPCSTNLGAAGGIWGTAVDRQAEKDRVAVGFTIKTTLCMSTVWTRWGFRRCKPGLC